MSGPGLKRTLMVGATSTVLVLAIAVGILLASGDPADGPVVSGESLAQAVTGTTDLFTDAESTADPVLPSAPGRYEPARDQWEAVLARLEPLVAAAPDDVNLKRKLAIAYYNLGMLEEAAAQYEELVLLDGDPVLRNRLGNTLRDMGRVSEAETEYRATIAADPSLAPPYLNLAESLWRRGEDERALAVLEQGIRSVREDLRGPLETARDLIAAPAD